MFPMPAASQSPFGAVLAVTFINSVGTGVVTNGIFFLTDGPAYGFTRSQNYLLGVALGVTYVAAALGTSRLLIGLRRMFPSLGARALLIMLMIGMGALCVIPRAAMYFAGPSGQPGAWSAWLLVCLYSPMAGVLWPLVEGYVSGGRSGASLRSAMGVWNVVWSSAIVVTYWGMSPLIRAHTVETILALGVLHMAAIPLILRFSADLPPHVHEEHEPHPPVYEDLMVTFRYLLPMSYLVSSALGPYLPGAMARLGVAEDWRAFLATAWLVPRVFTFLAMQRWQGWHGRWWPAILGGGLIVVGFGVCVLSPVLDGGKGGIAMMVTGLFMFGTGMATVYSAALYYGMEVQRNEADAGGSHEGLIGLGYTVGPLIGFMASEAAVRGMLPEASFEPVMLGLVALITAGVAGAVVRRVHRHTR